MLLNLNLVESKIFILFMNQVGIMSIIGNFLEHNRAGYGALEHSIIGKQKSIFACPTLVLCSS